VVLAFCSLQKIQAACAHLHWSALHWVRRNSASVSSHVLRADNLRWWIAGLVVHRKDKNWVIPFLFWLAIMWRLITLHIPITIVTKPMHWVWANTGTRLANLIPEKMRIPAAAALAIGVIIVGSFASAESEDNTRANRAVSLFGLAVFILGFWATSRNRSKIVWHTVIVGMLMQFIIALFVLRTGVGYDIFNFISQLARLLLGFAGKGTEFLTNEDTAKLTWFLITVIPAIIFFVSFVQLLYYWGILQWFIGKFAVFFFWSMRVSGAEAVVASASPFIGQGESAMLVRNPDVRTACETYTDFVHQHLD
jgi:CNT family concentrative nucleoside transporter